jgi:hypothetical protein
MSYSPEGLVDFALLRFQHCLWNGCFIARKVNEMLPPNDGEREAGGLDGVFGLRIRIVTVENPRMVESIRIRTEQRHVVGTEQLLELNVAVAFFHLSPAHSVLFLGLPDGVTDAAQGSLPSSPIILEHPFHFVRHLTATTRILHVSANAPEVEQPGVEIVLRDPIFLDRSQQTREGQKQFSHLRTSLRF